MSHKITRIVVALALCFLALAISIPFGHTQTAHPGKIVYEQNCLSCHQADGYGVPGMNPPLSKVEWVNGDKVRLIKIILNGMTSPIEVDGETYHNPMPSHAHLTDKEIADVLSFIRSNFGNKASSISANEVKAVRMKK